MLEFEFYSCGHRYEFLVVSGDEIAFMPRKKSYFTGVPVQTLKHSRV